MTFGEYMSISNSNGLGKFWASISTSCSMSLVNRGLLAPRNRATGRPLAQNKKVGRMSLQEQNQNVQHNAASQNFWLIGGGTYWVFSNLVWKTDVIVPEMAMIFWFFCNLCMFSKQYMQWNFVNGNNIPTPFFQSHALVYTYSQPLHVQVMKLQSNIFKQWL